MMAGGASTNITNAKERNKTMDLKEQVLRAEIKEKEEAALLAENSAKSANKKKKKKNKKSNASSSGNTESQLREGPSKGAMTDQQQAQSLDNSIWILGDQEERLRIREFWISLSVPERKQLVKLEKEAVLKKMKEQQKQTCSCSVCGRRRNDIENQLEVLYNTYYKELENVSSVTSTKHNLSSPSDGAAKKRQNPIPEMEMPPLTDEADEDEIDDEIEDCCLEEEYLVDKKLLFEGEAKKFVLEDGTISEFGSSLTVKGGILTVVDDFLTDDGKKFLDLMEALSKRKVIRGVNNVGIKNPVAPMAEETSATMAGLSDNEWDDYDESSASDGYEEDEELHMSDQQRLEESRRMFQIFAAKMFEQRVLTAYREKAALDRAARLMQELEEEENAKKREEERKKKEKEEAKQRKLEKEKEKQRLLKLKQEQEKALLEEKRQKEEEAKNKMKEEQKLKQQQAAAAKEEARLAEKARAEAKQLEKQKQKEKEKKALEEKIKKEADERAKKEAEHRAALKLAEEKKAAKEMARKNNEEQKKIELAKIRATEEKKREAARRNAEEKRKSDEEAVARNNRIDEESALVAAEEKKEKSRSLADEHSKKLKLKLETRAAQNAKKQIKEKKATKVSSILKPNSAPNPVEVASTCEHDQTMQFDTRMNYSSQLHQQEVQHQPEMTSSVRQFFESASAQQQQTLMNPPPGMNGSMFPPGYHPPAQEPPNFTPHQQQVPSGTSRLGITLQPMNNMKANSKLISNLTGLWSNPMTESASQSMPQTILGNKGIESSGKSVWNSSGIASSFNMGGLFDSSLPSHFNHPKPLSQTAKSNLYEDTAPDFLNIQQEILRSENMNPMQSRGTGRLGLHGMESTAWVESKVTSRLPGAPPPGFQNYGMESMGSSNNMNAPPPGFGMSSSHPFNTNQNQKQQGQGGISPASVSPSLWGTFR